MSGKITRKYCEENKLLFSPSNEQEKNDIIAALKSLGLTDCYSNEKKRALDPVFVYKGGFYPQSEWPITSKEAEIRCLADINDDYLPTTKKMLTDEFNKLSAKVDTLAAENAALRKMIAEIHNEIVPEKIEKTPLNLQ